MAKFTWTIQVTVDEIWVADGFNVTDERATEWLAQDLGWASPEEFSAKVIKTPNLNRVAKVQGYKTAIDAGLVPS